MDTTALTTEEQAQLDVLLQRDRILSPLLREYEKDIQAWVEALAGRLGVPVATMLTRYSICQGQLVDADPGVVGQALAAEVMKAAVTAIQTLFPDPQPPPAADNAMRALDDFPRPTRLPTFDLR